MAVSYKPVSFSPSGEFSRDKLNQMANNDQWLFEQMPRMLYNAHKVKRTASLKIACGIASFAPTTSGGRNVPVYFGTFFSTGCRPTVTTGTNSRDGQRRMFATIGGLETATLYPDHRGFRAFLWRDVGPGYKNYIAKTQWVHWQAVGW